MGEFRDYRCTIPGALILLICGLTLFASTDFVYSPLVYMQWIKLSNPTNLLAVLITFVVTSLAGGYLCGLMTNIFFGTPGTPYGGILPVPLDKHKMLHQLHERFQNVDGLKHLPISESLELTTECSLRCHSHAPLEVLNFARRRLTAVYVGLNSFWAFIIGYAFALLIIIKNKDACTFTVNWCNVVYLVPMMIILFCALLLWNAHVAAKEQWKLVCKFIEWDVITNPPQTKKS